MSPAPAVRSLPNPDQAVTAPLETDGPLFTVNGQPWRWRGVTAFRLLDRFARGESIDPFLAAYRGFNLLRVFPYVPVKDWGAAAWDSPALETVLRFLAYVAERGWRVELTLLTDDDPARIAPARLLLRQLGQTRPANLVVEVANEPRVHKAIDTTALWDVAASSGLLVSSGEYEDSRLWWGSYLTAHTARDAEWPRRAHDLLDYWRGGGPSFPEEPAVGVPVVADEPIRPDQAGYLAADFRAYAGTCALLGAGATMHTGSGRFADLPTAAEQPCIAAFLEGLKAFPADAPRGAYARPVEAALRTYQVGPCMVRVRPSGPWTEPGWTALDADGILWRRT